MPSSGSGSGTPAPASPPGVPGTSVSHTVVSPQDVLVKQESVVKLSRYAQLIGGYAECAVFGVNRAGAMNSNECYQPWSKDQRDYVAFYLAEAQREIEREARYFLEPKWVVGTLSEQENGDDNFIDAQPWKIPLLAKWNMVIEGGVRAESSIAEDAVVSHVADPAVIGPLATTVTDPREIKIYYPDTDIEITPYRITIDAGYVTITVPRCRMVKESVADNDQNGIDYATIANFQDTVDVKRIYNDPSTNAVLVTPHTCGSSCGAAGCSEYTQTGCIYIKDGPAGHLTVLPATYTGGQWVSAGKTCRGAELVRLYYRSGLRDLTKQAEDAIRMLAHAKMPYPPCSCDILHRIWERDRNVPSVLTRDRINCPFGMEDGAWKAYKFAQSMKKLRLVSF